MFVLKYNHKTQCRNTTATNLFELQYFKSVCRIGFTWPESLNCDRLPSASDDSAICLREDGTLSSARDNDEDNSADDEDNENPSTTTTTTTTVDDNEDSASTNTTITIHDQNGSKQCQCVCTP